MSESLFVDFEPLEESFFDTLSQVESLRVRGRKCIKRINNITERMTGKTRSHETIKEEDLVELRKAYEEAASISREEVEKSMECLLQCRTTMSVSTKVVTDQQQYPMPDRVTRVDIPSEVAAYVEDEDGGRQWIVARAIDFYEAHLVYVVEDSARGEEDLEEGRGRKRRKTGKERFGKLDGESQFDFSYGAVGRKKGKTETSVDQESSESVSSSNEANGTSVHYLDIHSVVQLKSKGPPIAPGIPVLAVYPDTTTFYPATIISLDQIDWSEVVDDDEVVGKEKKPSKSQQRSFLSSKYAIRFQDDKESTGWTPVRLVPKKYVIEMPKIL
eukprot:TRINITY_DN81586_c0_g1_i1.p1 TRINITY_DN81586_c0_g1~~TRINITY_DN81586_c0_g1_i1.p1  ORF type:complete len:329 (-),score=108.24 TRINITY_DN81586_c0_g1_i1:44-1030(-)